MRTYQARVRESKGEKRRREKRGESKGEKRGEMHSYRSTPNACVHGLSLSVDAAACKNGPYHRGGQFWYSDAHRKEYPHASSSILSRAFVLAIDGGFATQGLTVTYVPGLLNIKKIFDKCGLPNAKEHTHARDVGVIPASPEIVTMTVVPAKCEAEEPISDRQAVNLAWEIFFDFVSEGSQFDSFDAAAHRLLQICANNFQYALSNGKGFLQARYLLCFSLQQAFEATGACEGFHCLSKDNALQLYQSNFPENVKNLVTKFHKNVLDQTKAILSDPSLEKEASDGKIKIWKLGQALTALKQQLNQVKASEKALSESAESGEEVYEAKQLEHGQLLQASQKVIEQSLPTMCDSFQMLTNQQISVQKMKQMIEEASTDPAEQLTNVSVDIEYSLELMLNNYFVIDGAKFEEAARQAQMVE